MDSIKKCSRYLEGNRHWVPLRKGQLRGLCAHRASASEVGKVSTPGGLPFRGSPGVGSRGGRQVVATVLINLGKKYPAWRLKGKGKRVLGARETRGARKEGGKRFFVCSAGFNSRASKVF